MPWKECHVMDERLRFVARLLDGEKMAPLCAEFGISRKTGYKIYDRYKDCGVHGLDRSQPAAVSARQSAAAGDREADRAAEEGVSQLGRAQDSRAAAPAAAPRRTARRSARCMRCSIGTAWSRAGAAAGRARRPAPRCRGPTEPNALWCADYKGEFMLGRPALLLSADHHRLRQPLSARCEALSTTQERYAFTVFERAFKDFGLPDAIRTDNGVPFASPNALYGLSKLSVWWLRLGIQIERIKPGHPEQNGRHERMHLTLRREATKPAAANVLQQQARFDAFVAQYNHERPHQALEMQVPGRRLHALAARLSRPRGARPIPFHDWTVTVTHCGRICFKRRKVNLSQVFAGQNVGVRKSATASGSSPSCTTIWATSTMRRAGSNRSTIRSARKCYPCLRNELSPMCSGIDLEDWLLRLDSNQQPSG